MGSLQKATLADVAKLAGVSAMTASRCLRGDSRHSRETRDSVEKAAAALGYKVHPHVASLMTQVRQRRGAFHGTFIGVLSNQPESIRKYHTQSRYEAGVFRRAAALGYACEVLRYSEHPGELAALERVLHTRRAAGIVVLPPSDGTEKFLFDWTKYAAAALAFGIKDARINRASPNHYQGALLALQNVKRLGYRRPLLLLPEALDDRVNRAWAAAVLASGEGRVLLLKRHGYWFDGHRPEEIARKIQNLGADVILSVGSEPHEVLASSGMRIPESVGYVDLDLDPDANGAGIDQQEEVAGEAAVDIVVGEIQRNESGPRASPLLAFVNGAWRDGPTLPPRNPSRKGWPRHSGILVM